MNRRKLLTLTVLSTGLTGCLNFQPFQRPETDLPKRWKERPGKASVAKLPEEWWRSFGSSELNRLVAQSMDANQDLKGALARLETGRALVGVKRADWFPQISLGGDLGTQRLSASSMGANFPAGGFPGGALPELQRERYRAAFDAGWELDLWGRVRRGVESATASAAAEEERVYAQRLSLAGEVARNYFILRSIDQQRDILRDTIKLRQDALKLQKSRFDGGLANDMDVARSTTELELANNDLAATERQRGSAEHALAVLCGQVPSVFKVASSGALPGPPTVPAGLPGEVLERRPDIRAAEQTLRGAYAEIGVADASFFPTIKLLGSGGLESVKASDFALWENRVLSIGPSVTVPLLNGGRLKANRRAAQSRYDEALANYRQTILNALREVEDALLDLQAFGKQRQALVRAQDSAKDTSELATLRYEKGLASYFEVVEADRTVLSTRLAIAQLDGQRLASTVLLMKALGGGWSR
jgi:multidrug efflux system outer membrane protein